MTLWLALGAAMLVVWVAAKVLKFAARLALIGGAVAFGVFVLLPELGRWF